MRFLPSLQYPSCSFAGWPMCGNAANTITSNKRSGSRYFSEQPLVFRRRTESSNQEIFPCGGTTEISADMALSFAYTSILFLEKDREEAEEG